MYLMEYEVVVKSRDLLFFLRGISFGYIVNCKIGKYIITDVGYF